MRILITGGTGLIGTRIRALCTERGVDVTVTTRGHAAVDGATTVRWDSARETLPPAALDGVDAVVNLAGASVGEGRWTAERKAAIIESRVSVTRGIVDALQDEGAPRVLVNASAVGYYGNRPDEVDETGAPGDDFLARVARAWETEARRAEDFGVRVVLVRTGLVLSMDGGAFPKLLKPARMGAGGPIGGGGQWYPWIHVDDIAALFLEAVTNPAYSGPVIGSAPHPVQQRDMAAVLGRVLERPSRVPTPAIAMKLLLGEQSAVVLEGQHAMPRAAQANGFHWDHPDLEPALRALLPR